ncbi:MAG TPA: TonB-dependent receptor [Terricaulis sp.]|nr:TonB-dependent receptor [Terricaulis sp.]
MTKTTRSMRSKGWLLGATMLAGVAIIAPAAHAQDDDAIVVTGSGRADSTLTAPSPVVSVGGDDLRTSGQIDVGSLLRESPALNASLPGSFSAFGGTPLGASTLNLRNLGDERTLVLENGRRHVAGIEGTGSVDVNTLSTALLERVDVFTGGASAVYGADAVTGVVNFVLRDGASFDGLEVRAQTGITDNGDAEEAFISIANGFSTADGRGSLVFAAEYQMTEPVFAGDRDFAGSGLRTFAPNGPGTGADPRFSNTWVRDYRLPISSDAGIITVGPAGSWPSAFVEAVSSGGVPGCASYLGVPTCQIVGANGVLRPYNPGNVFIDGFNASGGDGVPGSPDDELILPDTRRALFQVAAEYELAPSVNFFIDAKYVRTETRESNQVNGFNDDIPIALDNPFIPAALQAQITTLQGLGESPEIVMSRDVLDMAGRGNPVANRETLRIVAGFNGDIGSSGLTYEVAYNYGRTNADITTRERIEDRYFAAIDAVEDPSNPGQAICRVDALGDLSYVPPSSPYPAQNASFGISTFGLGECVPVNLFGYNSMSAEAAAFIFQPGTAQNDIMQQNFIASIAGDTAAYFNLPAGPIGFAAGYEWRREKSAFTPDPWSAAGLTFGTIDSNGGPTNASLGSYEVSEFFAEARVPILANLPLVEYLELSGAFRASDYDTFGDTETWSVGGRWSPFNSLTLRATLSEAVRVPNIGEAFSPTFTISIAADADPCNPQFINAGSGFRFDNCVALIGSSVTNGTYNSTNYNSARVPGQNGGNPNLDPEEAETFTVGGVWRPVGDFGGIFDGLIVTVDYYKINIDGMIGSLAPFTIAQNCVDAATIANQFCAAIDRDPVNGNITGFRSGYINLAAVETDGIDWRVDYAFDLPAMFGMESSLRLTSLGTRFLSHDETRDVSAPDQVTDVLTSLTYPEWIINFGADWSVGKLTLGWSGRYESDQLAPGIEPQDLQNDPDYADITSTGSSWVHNLSASFEYSERIQLFGGVNNVTEEEPYIGTLGRPAGPRGRFFFAGVNAKF